MTLKTYILDYRLRGEDEHTRHVEYIEAVSERHAINKLLEHNDVKLFFMISEM